MADAGETRVEIDALERDLLNATEGVDAGAQLSNGTHGSAPVDALPVTALQRTRWLMPLFDQQTRMVGIR